MYHSNTAHHNTLVYRLTQILIKLNQGEKLDPQALAAPFSATSMSALPTCRWSEPMVCDRSYYAFRDMILFI